MVVVLHTAVVALTLGLAQQPETMSLLKEPLYPPPVSHADRGRLEAEIARARDAVGRDPANADAVLRLARAQRDLGHVGDALETLTRAIEGKADTPAVRLERARGYVVIRKFEVAQREFRKVAETLPEAHCDIGFTLYLLTDFKQAHEEYGRCAQSGVFAYLSARRAGADPGPRPAPTDEADPHGAPVKMPGSVASQAPRPEATMHSTYMDAVDRLIAGDKATARSLLKPIVEKRKDQWMEPVYIAAEADYARVALPVKHKKKK
jgi:tetratricopeptide (TPR) repeat protein